MDFTYLLQMKLTQIANFYILMNNGLSQYYMHYMHYMSVFNVWHHNGMHVQHTGIAVVQGSV